MPSTMVDALHTTNVNLGGLLGVLSQHLYSTPVVAVRELIQNAHDAISRRRIEAGWQETGHIHVGSEGNVLRISDNGSGLTEPEIHAMLATVGIGYTRQLREQNAGDQLIGLFGLGFLSAFVVARKVSVITCSYRTPGETWRYQSLDGEQYWVSPMPSRGGIGTTVELELRDDYAFLADMNELNRVTGFYCALLREPIFIGDNHVNDLLPPWRVPAGAVALHPVQARKRDLAFASRFEKQFEPLCTMPVRTTADSDVQGMLWVQDGSFYGGTDNRKLSVFVRGMLLDDNASDLLPHWAGFISGVIESSHLTPTASREDLQRDAGYQQARASIEQALINGLVAVAAEQPEAWQRVLARHGQELLGAALCDDRLFDLLAASVPVPTSHGDMTVRGLEHDGAIHVSMGSGGFEDMLARALGTPVARGDRYAVLGFLRRWVERRGGRLVELGTERGDHHLFQAEPLAPAETDWLQAQLCSSGEKIIAARFRPEAMPLVLVPDRDAELKQRLEADRENRRISLSALRLARSFAATLDGGTAARLYLNLDNPAIHALLARFRQAPDQAGQLAPALSLLRAFKVVLMGAGSSSDTGDFNRAFHDIAEAVMRLLANSTQRTEEVRA
jgi:molecular chaperone HtpG